MSERIHKVMYGKTERMSFSKIKDIIDMPYLIEVQKDSYRNFVDYGLAEVFKDFSPIVDFSGRMSTKQDRKWLGMGFGRYSNVCPCRHY